MSNKSNPDGIAWRTFLLEGYNNSVIDILRKQAESFRIDKSYPTLIGSIQEQFLPNLFANGNLESGLIDRILFTYKLTSNKIISRSSMPKHVSDDYHNLLKNVFDYRFAIESSEETESYCLQLDQDAEDLLIEYVQDLIFKQETAPENIKQYLSKAQISICKIVIIAHLILNAGKSNFQNNISKKSVELAIEMNEFYVTNFKIINKLNSKEKKSLINDEDIIQMAIKNGASQKDVVAVIGKDKSTVSRKWTKVLKQHGNPKLKS